MAQATVENLSEAMHEYVQAHSQEGSMDVLQLAFLESLKHPLAGPVVLGFVNRTSQDVLTRLRREKSDLVPFYEGLQILG